ncbi:MAG: hypothetical protein HYX63_03315 [Gammaproteobacteria bacterium]|nr:hypothetical protein [Gammaproteobacteria bacterium]
MALHSIDLTPEEQELKAAIHFEYDALKNYEIAQSNGERAALLYEKLEKRGVIPEHRMRYWNDPRYNHGRMKGSHKHIFERNGTTGREIYEHANFLKYLKYFLDGADLPAPLISRFAETVSDIGHVSGSDALDLAKEARVEVRRYGMEPRHASEEYYKLALDCGIAQMWANTIRENLRRMR